MEWRSYEGGRGTTTAPVFSLGSQWQIRDQTSISLEAYHRIFAAASQAEQNYSATNLLLTGKEMLAVNFDAAISVGYEHAEYSTSSTSSTTLNADRKDDYYLTRAGVHWAARRWCDLGLFYEFSINDSSGSQAHAFRHNRVGMSLTLAF